MSNVYVSSTFEDLRDHRARVRQMIRRLGHIDVTMEYYVAEARRPLERCLADVRSCDVYTGIFAWRYGYTPPGQSRSITELEFREAVRSDKPVLCFLVDDSVPWPDEHVDKGESRHRVESLRAELASSYLCGFFSGPDDLAVQVLTALSRESQLHRTPLDYHREQRLMRTWRVSEDPIDRTRARTALVHMESPRFAAEIKAILTDGRGGEETLAYLEDLVRVCTRRSEIIAVFAELLTSPEPRQMQMVVFSIGELALRGVKIGSSIVSELLRCSEDSAAPVRKEIAHALGKIFHEGGAPSDVISVLRRLAADSEPDVSETAQSALLPSC